MRDVENAMVNDAYWADYERWRYQQDLEDEMEEDEDFFIEEEEEEYIPIEDDEERMPFYMWSQKASGYFL